MLPFLVIDLLNFSGESRSFLVGLAVGESLALAMLKFGPRLPCIPRVGLLPIAGELAEACIVIHLFCENW